MQSDVWLRRIWLVNGVVLLAALIIGLVFAVGAWVSDWRGQKAVAVAAPSDHGDARSDKGVRALRFDLPQTIRGTGTQLVLVHNGADYTPAGSGSSPRKQSGLYERGDGPTVNVAFLPANGAPAHLLLDGPAHLIEVSFPGASYGRADSLQTWISYEAVLTDSNGDGSLDENDERELLITDLNGNNLRRVLPSGLRLEEYRPLKDQKTLIVTALELPKGSNSGGDERRARERAFLYDVPSGRLQPYTTLDSLVARAASAMSGRIPAAQSR